MFKPILPLRPHREPAPSMFWPWPSIATCRTEPEFARWVLDGSDPHAPHELLKVIQTQDAYLLELLKIARAIPVCLPVPWRT